MATAFLFAYANDRASEARYLRNLADEQRAIKKALRAASDAAKLKLVECHNATIDDVLEECERHGARLALFHFAGHADGASLVFEDRAGRANAAVASSVAAFLGGLRGLKLVVLNGCSTDAQVAALLRCGVTAVVATSTRVRDDVATSFASHLYAAIGNGETIADAFQHASRAVIVKYTAGAAAGGGLGALCRDVAPDDAVDEPALWTLHGSTDATSHRFVEPAEPVAAEPEPEDPVDWALVHQVLRKIGDDMKLAPRGNTWDLLPTARPIAVDVGRLELLGQDRASSELAPELVRRFEDVRDEIHARTGMRVPGIQLRGTDELGAHYVISVRDIPLVSGALYPELLLCLKTPSVVASYGISATPGRDPLTGADATWIVREQWERARRKGLRLLAPLDYVARHVSSVITKNLPELLDLDGVHQLLSEQQVPELAAIVERGALGALREVLCCLLEEEVPITELRELAPEFVRGLERGERPADAVERLRGLPAVRGKLPGNRADARVLRIGDAFADQVRDGIVEHGGAEFLTVTPNDVKLFEQALTEHLDGTPRGLAHGSKLVVVVGDPKLRRLIRKLVELNYPQVPVLAAGELIDELADQEGDEIDVE